MNRPNTILFILLLCAVQVTTAQKKWTLQECIEYAFENNITVKQAELNILNADIDRLDAIGNFIPSLNGNSSLSSNTGANVNPVTNTFENRTFLSFTAGLGSGLTLFDGLRNFNQLQRAKLNRIAAQYQLDSAKDDIALFVTNNFLNVLFNKENLKVFEAQLAQTKLQLDLTQERIDAGMIPSGDILDIEATYAQQQQQIITAKNNIVVTLISLAQALNLQNPEDFDIVEPNVDDIPLYDITSNTPADLYKMALDFRNEIKVAEQNIELAETDLKISRGAYYPTLNAFINYNTRYSNTDFFDRGFKKQLYENDGLGYGVALNVPIFNGWAVRNNVKRNKINVERQRLQYEQTELDLRTNVYQAYNDALGSKATFDASLKTQQARKQAYDYAKERYDVGLMNAFDFSQSQTQFTTAQNEVIRSKYDYIFRIKLLELLFGVRPTELRL